MNFASTSSNKNSLIGLVFLFIIGYFAYTKLPIQLSPDVSQASVNIEAFWRAASPVEMDREIFRPIEKQMREIPAIQSIETYTFSGYGWMTLKFKNIDEASDAIVDISAKLNQITSFPKSASKPFISKETEGSALSWLFLTTNRPGDDVRKHLTLLDEIIIPELKSINGISDIKVLNRESLKREVHINVDLKKMNELGISLNQVQDKLQYLRDKSVGNSVISNLNYAVRYKGKLPIDELKNIIIDITPYSTIYLSSIASVESTFAQKRDMGYTNAAPAIPMRLDIAKTADVSLVFSRLKTKIAELNAAVLKTNEATLSVSFDPSSVITNAVDVLYLNLLLGTLIAGAILYVYLRSIKRIGIILLTAPICFVSVIIVLYLFDQTLNLITLAGLALAIGIILDPCIIITDQLSKSKKLGVNRDLTKALIISATTSIVIFVPIYLVPSAEKAIFGNLALSFSVSIAVSVVYAVFLIPILYRAFGIQSVQGKPASTDANRTSSLVQFICMPHRKPRIVNRAAATILASFIGIFAMAPSIDYLPSLHKGTVTSYLAFPGVYSAEKVEYSIINQIAEKVSLHSADSASQIKDYYIRIYPGGGSIEWVPTEGVSLEALTDSINNQILKNVQDLRHYTTPTNLFSAYGGSRGIKVTISSSDEKQLKLATAEVMKTLGEKQPDFYATTYPRQNDETLSFAVRPNMEHLFLADVPLADFVSFVQLACDGLYIDELPYFGQLVPFILKSNECFTPENLKHVSMQRENGQSYPLSHFAKLSFESLPRAVYKVNGRPSYAINISIPNDYPINKAITKLETQLMPVVKQVLGDSGYMKMSGAQKRVDEALTQLSLNAIIAFLILLLIMAIHFKSMGDSLLVASAFVPATIGALLSLQLLNLALYQPLDIISLMGFIVMCGIVANSAILIVQEFNSHKNNLGEVVAIEKAVSSRTRPICLTVITTVGGLIPMILFPDESTVIYRGLATVVAGGVLVGSIFSLVALPRLILSCHQFNTTKQPHQSTIEAIN